MINSKITGTGSYLPEKILTNADLEKMVDTNNEWILERTGISERRIASPQENTSDLCFNAASMAIESAGITPDEIDFIFVATTSPDRPMPNTATIVQTKLKAKKAGALDVSAACSGFIYGLSMADQLIKSGNYRNILVIGAEILSRFTDYTDRGTCILFGDGAGAVVLSPITSNDSAILGHSLSADGSLGEHLTMPIGGSEYPANAENLKNTSQYIHMNGREIFKHATKTMVRCCEAVLEQSKTAPEKVDWLIPHQANLRIIEAVAKRFGFPLEKVIIEIQKMGNNSAASIPICIDKAVRDGRVKRGQNLMLTAFGGGVTSGSVLLRY